MDESVHVGESTTETAEANLRPRFVEYETAYGIVVRLEFVGNVDQIRKATLIFPTGDENLMTLKTS